MNRRFVLILPLLALSACATPETRLRTGLMNAGLSAGQSACMADRMVDKLSLIQLRRIASLKNFQKQRIRDMTLEKALHNIRSLEDPEILAVTTRAALSCAISG
jgi:hypothetical protein